MHLQAIICQLLLSEVCVTGKMLIHGSAFAAVIAKKALTIDAYACRRTFFGDSGSHSSFR
jgi:hypothetical protein